MLYVTLTRGSWTDAQREADSIREQECRPFTDNDSKGAANPRFICLSMGPDYAWTEMVEMEKARRVITTPGHVITGQLHYPAASSVPRWLTICLQWLLFQQMHYHGSESRVMPLRGIELF